MGDASSIKAGDAYVEIGADDKGMQRALNNIAARFRGLSSIVNGVGSAMMGAAAAITGPLTLAAVTSASTGAALFDMSRRTGIAASRLSELGFAAGMTGTDLDTVEAAIRRMQKSIAGLDDIHEGTSAKAIEELGISMEAIKGQNPADQFERVAGAIAAIEDPTERAAAVMKVFGRSGTALIPMIEQLKQLEGAARKFGFVRSDEDIRAAKELSNMFQLAKRAASSLADTLTTAIMPALREHATIVFRGVVAMRDWIAEHKASVATLFKVATAAGVAGGALVVLGTSINIVSAAIRGLGLAMSLGRGAIGGLLSIAGSMLTVLTSVPVLIGGAVAGLAVYFASTTEAGGQMVTTLGAYFGDLKDTALESFGGISDALSAGEWGLAAKIAWTGLKLAWTQGIAPLKQAWSDFTYGFQTLAFDAFYGVQEVWETVRHALTVGWAATTNALGSTWDAFVGLIKDAWSAVSSFLQKSWNKVRAVFDSDFDADTANSAIDEATAKARAEQQKKELDAAKTRDAEHNRETEEEAKRHKERMDQIDEAHKGTQDAIDQDADEREKATQDELDKLKQELRDLRSRASTAKDKNPVESFLPKDNGGRGIPPEDLNRVMKTVNTVGTFNKGALFGLAGKSSKDETLTVQKRTVQVLENQTELLTDIKRGLSEMNRLD